MCWAIIGESPNPSDPSILHMGALYALIGLSSGSCVFGTTPLMDSLGLDNLTRVYSYITAAQGVAHLTRGATTALAEQYGNAMQPTHIQGGLFLLEAFWILTSLWSI